MYYKFKKNRDTTQKGFTLLEALLYVSISGSILLAATLLSILMLEVRTKGQVVAEVESQGMYVMNIVTQAVRNAESITTPSDSATTTSLTLDVFSASEDPTVFDIDNSVIRIKEGSANNVPLTNSKVEASNLSFNNYSLDDTPGSVSISFTLSHINSTNRQVYNYEKTFYGSASLRSYE